jgi:hypothetical protein
MYRLPPGGAPVASVDVVVVIIVVIGDGIIIADVAGLITARPTFDEIIDPVLQLIALTAVTVHVLIQREDIEMTYVRQTFVERWHLYEGKFSFAAVVNKQLVTLQAWPARSARTSYQYV